MEQKSADTSKDEFRVLSNQNQIEDRVFRKIEGINTATDKFGELISAIIGHNEEATCQIVEGKKPLKNQLKMLIKEFRREI